MFYTYISALYKSNYVVSSAKLNLSFDSLAPKEMLAIAKRNNLEFYKVSEKGKMDLQLDLQLFANIFFICGIPSGSKLKSDYLFLLTSDLKYIFAEVKKNQQEKIEGGDINIQCIEKLDKDEYIILLFPLQVFHYFF